MTPLRYTRDRSVAVGFVLGWGILFALEAGALITLALIALPWIWLKPVAVALLLGGPTWTIAGMLAPLRTRHVLTPETLILHYGRDRLLLPRDRVVALARRAPSAGFSPSVDFPRASSTHEHRDAACLTSERDRRVPPAERKRLSPTRASRPARPITLPLPLAAHTITFIPIGTRAPSRIARSA